MPPSDRGLVGPEQRHADRLVLGNGRPLAGQRLDQDRAVGQDDPRVVAVVAAVAHAEQQIGLDLAPGSDRHGVGPVLRDPAGLGDQHALRLGLRRFFLGDVLEHEEHGRRGPAVALGRALADLGVPRLADLAARVRRDQDPIGLVGDGQDVERQPVHQRPALLLEP
jgi:hypothetical protein